jgi:hypothetical protein
MRGNPWIRIILVAFGVVLMGLPVWRLTHAVAPPEPTVRQEASAAKTLTVTVTFAHAPESFDLTNLGKSILSGAGPTAEFTSPWQISLPKEGTDLLLKVKWPANAPRTAVEIRVESSGDVLADQTFWGTGTLTELLTVLPVKP